MASEKNLYVTLNNGVKIPQLGYGVYLVPENECVASTLEALKVGYRHIDTAHAYNNEKEVGEAIKKSGIPRNEIFVTSKLWPHEYGEGKTLQAIDKMLKRLDLDYIDLVLLHQPYKDYLGAYKDMEKAVGLKKVRCIGISNFIGEDLEKILKNATIMPVVDQVECHPLFPNKELNQKLKEKNIFIESWFPICHGDKLILENELVLKIAQKYVKTAAQVILRWHIQMGYIPLVKSVKPERILENFSIFDFVLSDEDMKEFEKLPTKQFFTPEQRKQFAENLDNYKPKYE